MIRFGSQEQPREDAESWRQEFAQGYSGNTRRLDVDVLDATSDIRRILPRMPIGCNVLELACGEGEVLASLADAGFHCTGIELDPEAAARAQRRLGVAGTVSCGDALR